MKTQNDLRILPKLRDSITYLYVEHCIIEQNDSSIMKVDQEGRTPIPIATICLLMLGPGVSITHAAIRNIAACGCMVCWCGESGLSFYAFGKGETRSSRNLLKQVNAYSDIDKRLECVKKMYYRRFPEMPSDNLTLEQLRGLEGVRVKMAYKNAAKANGVKWYGRDYSESDWDSTDPVNRALSQSNHMLYALCYSAIITLGYSPGIGFIHTGKADSFVYDLADLYKADTTIPLSFEAANQSEMPVEKAVRIKTREYFYRFRILKRIPEDIAYILGDVEEDEINGNMNLWSGEGELSGGKNYGKV